MTPHEETHQRRLQMILSLLLLCFSITLIMACVSSPTPRSNLCEGTISPSTRDKCVEQMLEADREVQRIGVSLTKDAIQEKYRSTSVAEFATATAEAVHSTSTAVVQATRSALELQSTQLAQTVTALELSKQQFAATQSASATVVAAQVTQTAVDRRLRDEEAAAQAAAESRQFNATVDTIARTIGIALAIALPSLLLYAAFRWLRAQEIIWRTQKDEKGNVVFTVLRIGGKEWFIAPDRMHGPAMHIDENGVEMPELVEQDRQERTTARAQWAHIVREGGNKHSVPMPYPSHVQPASEPVGGMKLARYEIVDAESVRPWINDVETYLLSQGDNT